MVGLELYCPGLNHSRTGDSSHVYTHADKPSLQCNFDTPHGAPGVVRGVCRAALVLHLQGLGALCGSSFEYPT